MKGGDKEENWEEKENENEESNKLLKCNLI